MRQRLRSRLNSVISNLELTVGQPVAVYWDTNPEGNYEFYAGTVDSFDGETVVVNMNFGGTETLGKGDFSSVVPLSKPLPLDTVYTKAEIGKFRVKTVVHPKQTVKEPPLFKQGKNSENNLRQVVEISNYLDSLLQGKLAVPPNHVYQMKTPNSPNFLRDFSAWLTPLDKEEGYTVEIRFKTGEYDAIVFAKRGDYYDSTIDLVEPFRDKSRFIKGNSWKELAENAANAVNHVIEKAPETIEKVLRMRKEGKEAADRANEKEKQNERTKKLPTLIRKNNKWVVLNEFNNEISEYEGMVAFSTSKSGMAVVYFYKDTRYLVLFKGGDDPKQLVKEDTELRAKEHRFLELFKKSDDPTSFDWGISQQGDTSIFIERDDKKDFTPVDIKSLENWLNPFGFKISRGGNIWYEGFQLVDGLAKSFILELVNKTNHEAQTTQKSIDKARSAKEDTYLDEPVSHNGSNTTRRQMIDSFVRQGAVLKNDQKHSKAESDKLMREYQMVSKNAPIGNVNHPQTQRLMQLREQLNDPSNPIKGYGFWVVKDSWYLDWKGKTSSELTPVMLKYAREQLDKKELGLK